MALIMLQSIDIFLRENKGQNSALSIILEKVAENVLEIQEKEEDINNMELFMFILKELDLFLKIKMKE